MSISYWLDESQTSKKGPKKNYDYLIIGAGIAGLSTAYWLEKRAPQAQIAVIDKYSLAYGASGRNAGFVTCGSALHFNKLNEKFGLAKAQEIWRFSEMNRELLLKEIIQDQSENVDYKTTGSRTVIPDDTHAEKFQSTLRIMKSAHISVDLIDAKTLQKDYAVKGSAGAIEYKDDGVIHPVKLLKLIQSKLKKPILFLAKKFLKFNQTKTPPASPRKNKATKPPKYFFA